MCPSGRWRVRRMLLHGLAYHYFDSKERMFAEAIEDYASRCAEGVCEVLGERGVPLDEKLERALETGARHGGYPYAEFFHAQGHGALHDRLSLAMCEVVRPHLREALETDAAERGVATRDADELAAIMVYGCVGLASGPGHARRLCSRSGAVATSVRCSPSSARGRRCRKYFAPVVAGALLKQKY